jgi:hypothetical protein
MPPVSRHQRGLGSDYDRRRALLPQPRDGQLCPRCGEPLLDGRPLDAGHEVDRALGGGETPLRWEHAECNRRAGGKLSQVLGKVRRMGSQQVEARPSRRW